MTDFMTRADLARMFKVKLPRLRQMLAGELKAMGFPEPTLGTTRQGQRWDPFAIEAWRRSRYMPPVPLETHTDLAPDQAAATMDRRARDLAAGKSGRRMN